MEHVIFSYGIPDIQKEVEKRTSYLEKMRATDKEEHQLQQLSLMQGEDFLFKEYLQEAAAEVYDWIKPFCRDIVDAYRIDFHEVHTVYENFGVKLKKGDSSIGKFTDTITLDDTNSIVKPASSSDVTKDAFKVTVDLTDYNIEAGQALSVSYSIKLKYRRGLLGLNEHEVIDLNQTEYEETRETEFDCSLELFETTFEFPKTDFVKSLRLDDITITVTGFVIEKSGGTFAAGSYIHFYKYDGTDKYLLLTSTVIGTTCVRLQYTEDSDGFVTLGTDTNLETTVMESSSVPTDSDCGNKITYHLDIPDWQDKNQFPRIDRLIREMIVHYIIWRWFETVNPKEAEYYRKKWEENAENIQHALNSEKYILKRQYKMF